MHFSVHPDLFSAMVYRTRHSILSLKLCSTTQLYSPSYIMRIEGVASHSLDSNINLRRASSLRHDAPVVYDIKMQSKIIWGAKQGFYW